jgi:hypothetical protein
LGGWDQCVCSIDTETDGATKHRGRGQNQCAGQTWRQTDRHIHTHTEARDRISVQGRHMETDRHTQRQG